MLAVLDHDLQGCPTQRAGQRQLWIRCGEPDPDRGRQLLVLVHGRLRGPVGEHHPVGDEVAVVRLVAEVAAVGPAESVRRLPGLAAVRHLTHRGGRTTGATVVQALRQAVVPELPDEAALQAWGRLDRLPVLGQRAVAVAHRVRVLTHDQRMPLLPARGVCDDRLDRRVHRAGQVARGLVAAPVEHDRALVVQRPGRIEPTQPAGGGVVVRAVAALVAQRPEDDAGVVQVPARHPRDSVDEGGQVVRVVGQVVGVGVTFDVRLVDHHQAQLVGQVQQRRVVRVVRRAYRVEAEPLHRQQVLADLVARYGPTTPWVEVVPVHPAQVWPHAVQQQVEPDDLDRPEADPVQRGLDHRSGRVVQRDGQVVQPRRLGRPRQYLGHGGSQPAAADPERAAVLLDRLGDLGDEPTALVLRQTSGRAQVDRSHRRRRVDRQRVGTAALAVLDPAGVDRAGRLHRRREVDPEPVEAGPDRPARGHPGRPGRADLDQHGQLAGAGAVRPEVARPGRPRPGLAGAVPPDQAGVHPDVGQVHRRGRVEEGRPGQTAVPPLVLVLDEARVGPLHHGQPDRVGRTGPDHGGDVELRGQVRVLADADPPAVHLDDQHALGGSDVQHRSTPAPAGRHVDLPLVDPGRIRGRWVRRQVGPRHLHVRVVRPVVDRVDVVELLQRPAAGHHQLSRGGAVRRQVERLLRGAEQLEAPDPVQVDPGHPGLDATVTQPVHRKPPVRGQGRVVPGSVRHAPLLSPRLRPSSQLLTDRSAEPERDGPGAMDNSARCRFAGLTSPTQGWCPSDQHAGRGGLLRRLRPGLLGAVRPGPGRPRGELVRPHQLRPPAKALTHNRGEVQSVRSAG